jgi:hypothetical protein
MKYIPIAATALVLSGLPTMAIAQDETPVTKEEYNELKKEVEELKAMIRLLTEQSGKAVEPTQNPAIRPAAQPASRPAPQPVPSSGTVSGGESPTTISLRNEVKRANRRIDALEQKSIELDSAESAFLITGFALTRFNVPDGGDTVFNSSVSPIILWQINDKLLFESEFEFELDTVDGRADTGVSLEYADLQFLVNDNLTIGAGKFLTPFGLFGERLHPAWINKLPNAPLVRGHEGLAPMSSVGAFVKGIIPFDGQKIVYTVYAINGPTLVDAVRDPAEFGSLDFGGFSSNKAFGGRIGYLPIPQLELGYSFLFGEADSDNGLNAKTTVMGLDASYILDTEPGLFDFRFEYVYSTVDDVTYDASGAVGVGPITFNNERDGLYAQAAFRPIHSSSDFFKNVEFVGRYDYLSTPSAAPEGGNTDRWTAGINYWFNSSTVLKLAVDNVEHDGEEARQNVMLMLGVGF